MAERHVERHRLSGVVTRSGDRGQTGLADGQRLSKVDLTVELLGELDELNARLGMLSVSLTDNEQALAFVRQQQQAIFDLGGLVAMGKMAEASQLPDLARLEVWIEACNDGLPPLKEFILPGGTPAMAQGHLVRTATRRAERLAWAWCRQGRDDKSESMALREALAAYLNRLSDAWFVFSRSLDSTGQHTVYWRGASSASSPEDSSSA